MENIYNKSTSGGFTDNKSTSGGLTDNKSAYGELTDNKSASGGLTDKLLKEAPLGSDPPIYNGLCLSSGGIKGVLMLGALDYFYHKNKLQNIKYLAGTSVGSIIIFLLSVGYTPLEILAFSCDDEITKQLQNINLLNLSSIHGIYNNKIIGNFVEGKIKAKLNGISPTFLEFYKTHGKYLVIPVYCLSETVDKRKVICSPDDTPDMKIMDAILLSCNIPIIFEKAIYNDKVYIDGAYTSNFPVEYLKERILFNENNDEYKILGIRLKHSVLDLNNLLDYILAIQNIPLVEQNEDFSNDHNLELVNLEFPKEISMINFKLTTSKKSDLYNYGYSQVKDFYI